MRRRDGQRVTAHAKAPVPGSYRIVIRGRRAPPCGLDGGREQRPSGT